MAIARSSKFRAPVRAVPIRRQMTIMVLTFSPDTRRDGSPESFFSLGRDVSYPPRQSYNGFGRFWPDEGFLELDLCQLSTSAATSVVA